MTSNERLVFAAGMTLAVLGFIKGAKFDSSRFPRESQPGRLSQEEIEKLTALKKIGVRLEFPNQWTTIYQAAPRSSKY